METAEKKHWKTLEKEAKEKEDAKKLAEQNAETVNQEQANKTEVVDEILEKPMQENVEEKEPSIPLSQVGDLVAKEVAKAMANLPKQEIEKPAEVVKETYKPLSAKEENFDEIPGLEDFEVKDRLYVLCNNQKPPSRGIRNRSKAPLSPLTYLNPQTKQTSALRYSVNQVSFFMRNKKAMS